MLKVSRQPGGQPEIFQSLQGEGPTIGTPAVFLRLAQCNLSCSWCDTKYTWDWQHFDYDKEMVSLYATEAEERILEFGSHHLVITGGEPLLQQRELAPLVASLKERGFYCEVETNGTIVPQPDLAEKIDQWNVSPKLATSGNPLERRELPSVLEFFRQLPNAYFKFVIVEPGDIEEVCALRTRYRLPGERIILMPEGTTSAVIQRRGQWVYEACVREGFRFSTRLHILLWGDQRGR
ncbi:MAG: 7-carboxy-7-deazaguanine synthase QueE [Chloroflexota bacterium]